MLPCTGRFQSINCPFYDSGLCERPYCHFRHIKKDSQSSIKEELLQQVVSGAVKKIVQNNGRERSQESGESNVALQSKNVKATYNPTPISQLNKINDYEVDNIDETFEKRKHIPVPYTPFKPPTVGITRPVDSNGDIKPFVYIPPTTYTPGSVESKLDPYFPKGSSASGDNRYLPGSKKEIQQYSIVENKSPEKLNYVPSDKSEVTVNKAKLLEYKPTKVRSKNDVSKVTYQPTPLDQVPCFSSDEDEPQAKKLKGSSDIEKFDGLEDEFDILGQILDEEKSKDSTSKEDYNTNNGESKNLCKDDNEIKKEKKEKSNDRKSSSKSSHKSSHKEKYKDKNRESKSEKEYKSKEKEKYKEKEKSNEKDKSKEKEKTKDKQKPKERDKSKESYKHKERDKDRCKSKEKSIKKDDKTGSDTKNRSDRHSSSSSKTNKDSRHSSKSNSKHKDGNKSSRHSKEDKSKHSVKKHEKEKTIDNNTDNEYEDDISDADEETIASECKRFFEEYIPAPKVILDEENKTNEEKDEEYTPSKKRISRTEKNLLLSRVPIKPDFKVSAAQAMAERTAKIKEYHQSKLAEIKNDIIKINLNTSNKVRIAHVPYASNMLSTKKAIPTNVDIVKNAPSTSNTTIQTIKKGAQRVAHMPNEKFIDRPGVLEPLASKIPANIRSTYLNMMIDECLKIYVNACDAYNRAQHEELNTSKKCVSVQIYKNSAVLAVNRLRKEKSECNGTKKLASECSTLQDISNSNPSAAKTTFSWSIENKNKKNTDSSKQFQGAQFYKNISKWILNEEQLQENGFPRVHPSGEKGRAKIYKENNKQKPPKGFIRTCCRCKRDYTVDKKNFPVIKEECVYHPNNKYRFRGEVKYQCCSQDGTSDGCCVASVHVYEYVDYDNLKGYVKTLPPEKILEDYGVYALDCEMCYTTHGLDLTRVTVINSNCKVVYETLIKPLHPILDYNTRYSGITEEQMAEVKTTLLDVQATLLSMFNDKTILIGHSLESDFKALRIIHDTVIDTSVLFPHKMGPPHKRALRNLSSEYLRKIIQNSVDGHDSAEDALVCMELIIYKLKEDLKTR